MAKRALPSSTGPGAAPAVAAFLGLADLLDLPVRQGTLTDQAIGMALLNRALSLNQADPVQKAARELSKSHSEQHHAIGPSRPRVKAKR